MDFTEFSKIWEGYKDLPVGKIDNQMFKPHAMKDTRKFKQMAQQKYEYGADNPGWGEGGEVKKAHERRKPERAAKAYKKRREDKEKTISRERRQGLSCLLTLPGLLFAQSPEPPPPASSSN